MKNSNYYLTGLFALIIGFSLGNAGLNLSDWEFWVVLISSSGLILAAKN